MKSYFSNDILTKSFYTLEEAKITANVENKNGWITTIIDLENENIKWKGCEY
ncbi:hypothetical protein [Spiroplasma phoeniceum]|uniref:Uncharacterized protein n=1 Tax=Spiroplasma phoeniceum P40 TaxID=1276259 RepID=A0A345DMP5_9MOLU|nr:hypothetical protein [Spiroplasma phoeniceum]AXF95483.1 hypothetical protein SDAV_00489 [Spiroplasma phoeniceum P40]